VIEDPQRRMQLQALDNEIEYNEALITEREGEIQEIEQGITELNEIFRDLGTLVNEQESGIRMYNHPCMHSIRLTTLCSHTIHH
jgi:t-SNARE complex subunit (syntaxin)